MAKQPTRTIPVTAVKSHGGRGRVADLAGGPIRVSENAQAGTPTENDTRPYDFTRQADRSKLPQRPSTSGGPSGKFFLMRKNAERRETKDDLHFNNPLTAHATTFYHFPLPAGALPTPTSAPKSSPPLLQQPRSDTPKSIDAGPAAMSYPPADIGVALGSPTHQPLAWQQQQSYSQDQPQGQSDRFAMSPSPDIESSVEGLAPLSVPSRQKSSRWKVFGGLFGGAKKQTAPQAFYQVQPETNHQQNTAEVDYVHFADPPSNSEKRPKSRGRTRTISEKKSEDRRPDVKRSQTAPLAFDFASNTAKTLNTTPEIRLEGGLMGDHAQHGHKGLLLNVDIPTTQLERYSVMFGSVLSTPQNMDTSSSLLARRQATLDRLKTVNEALALKEQELDERAKLLRPRRATSPQPTKSPAFSLFPSTPSRLTVRDALPSPLQRSNTSPAALSPSRPSFTQHAYHETHSTLMEPAPHIPINPSPRNNSSSRKPRELKPSAKKQPSVSSMPIEVKTDWSVEESHLTLSPVGDVDSNVYDPMPFIMKPKLEEPTWQMLTRNPAPASSTSSRSDGLSASTSASSISTTQSATSTSTHKHVQIQAAPATRRNRSATTSSATRPRPEEASNATFRSSSPAPSSTPLSLKVVKSTEHEEREEREERLKSAADISMARQISVSRQQRQLLVPVKKPANISPTPSSRSGSSKFLSPSPFNIERQASPLGVVAAAAESPGTGSPHLLNQRLVQASAKPSTPTLVLVGGDRDNKWSGATTSRNERGKAESREIRVGLAVGSPLEMLGNRKSEQVIFERVH